MLAGEELGVGKPLPGAVAVGIVAGGGVTDMASADGVTEGGVTRMNLDAAPFLSGVVFGV